MTSLSAQLNNSFTNTTAFSKYIEGKTPAQLKAEMNSLDPNLKKKFINSKSDLAMGKKRAITRRLRIAVQRGTISANSSGIVGAAGLGKYEVKSKISLVDNLSDGNCFFSAIFQTLKKQEILNKIKTCIALLDIDSELAFIQSFRNILAEAILKDEDEYVKNMYELLNEIHTASKDDYKEALENDTYPGWMAITFKGGPGTLDEFKRNYAGQTRIMGNWTAELEAKIVEEILDKCKIMLVIITEKANINTTTAKISRGKFIYDKINIYNKPGDNHYQHIVFNKEETAAKTRKSRGIHGVDNINNSINLKWKKSSNIGNKPLNRGKVYTLGNIPDEKKKYYIDLDVRSPETGRLYNSDDKIQMQVKVKSIPCAELEIIGNKVKAIYFNINGKKFEHIIDFPETVSPCPDEFAKYGDKTVALSFEFTEYQPIKPAPPKKKEDYRFTYIADIFIDKNNMKPFVWYLNVEELKIPIYLTI